MCATGSRDAPREAMVSARRRARLIPHAAHIHSCVAAPRSLRSSSLLSSVRCAAAAARAAAIGERQPRCGEQSRVDSDSGDSAERDDGRESHHAAATPSTAPRRSPHRADSTAKEQRGGQRRGAAQRGAAAQKRSTKEWRVRGRGHSAQRPQQRSMQHRWRRAARRSHPSHAHRTAHSASPR